MRVALMARVSTARQGAEDRLSLPAQLASMRERCAREGWEVVAEYEAPGERAWVGSLSQRPVLERAVKDAEAGQFDILMVHEGSRLARKVALHLEVEERLERAGVRLLEATESLPLEETPELWMFGVNKAAMNEYWSRKVSQHAKKGYRELHRQGLPTGKVPFGYRRAPGSKVPEVVEEEAAAVREAFELYAAGVRSAQQIADDWTARGLRPHSQYGNERWSRGAVSELLGNDFYAGFVRHLGDRAPGQHAAIVSEELWARAQAVRRRMPRQTKVYGTLLAGVAVCAGCGSRLWSTGSTSTAKDGTKNVYRYYRERGTLRGEPCPSRGGMVRAEQIDAQVEAVLQALGSDEEWLAVVDREARRAPSARRTERTAIERRRQRITRAFLTPGSGLTEREYGRLLREVDAELAALPSAPGELALASARLRSWSELWAGAGAQWRQEVVRTVVEAARVELGSGRVWLEPATGFEGVFGLRAAFCCGAGSASSSVQPAKRLYLPSELVA